MQKDLIEEQEALVEEGVEVLTQVQQELRDTLYQETSWTEIFQTISKHQKAICTNHFMDSHYVIIAVDPVTNDNIVP